MNFQDPTGLIKFPNPKKFLKAAGKKAPLVCYVGKAAQDTDDSLKDEAKDLNDCFNPYAFVKNSID